MDYVELLHVRKVKAIEHIARITTDATLIGAKENTVAVNDGHARSTILTDELLAFG